MNAPKANKPHQRWKSRHVWSRLIGWGLLCYAVATYGAIVTKPEITTWYAALEKPVFSPPNWIFAPVWTALYALFALATWLATELPTSAPSPQSTKQKLALQLLAVAQLLLNAAWSFTFFGAHNPLFAMAVLLAMILLALVFVIKAHKARPLAALLFCPYILWISFAALLNGAIIVLNT
ncbi:TspO/MBR family protein [Polycladidibacter hongkongensis]|uniref:TspO/MBR family protein n=1 Tax=Polycladidibacter hongkongensis TaxID=1647556 RepID=UPI00083612CE|nr:TspO/MBR family protein [Pseudovibrio hongkongensis]